MWHWNFQVCCSSVPEDCFDHNKKYKRWWNAAFCGISSGSSLFVEIPVYGIPAYKVGKETQIRNRYNQLPHLTQGTTWESDKNITVTQESQAVSPSICTCNTKENNNSKNQACSLWIQFDVSNCCWHKQTTSYQLEDSIRFINLIYLYYQYYLYVELLFYYLALLLISVFY